MHTEIIYILCLLTIGQALQIQINNETIGIESRSALGEVQPRVLSRRKRYLTFPDGSSFQLAFCTQTHGYLQVGDIVWFGSTAALAWELPSDTQQFHTFKEYFQFKDVRRNGVIYYTDENGKVIDKKDYHRRTIVNPAFAKRSIDFVSENETKSDFSIKKMHEAHENINLFKDLDATRIDFHRNGRKSLYTKLETFMQGLGWNGRECVMKMLCEAGKKKSKQGAFLDEIIRAVFTLPKGHGDSVHHLQYDIAHEANVSCEELYPECELSGV